MKKLKFTLKSTFLLIAATCIFAETNFSIAAADTTIISDGKSTFTIIIPTNAPTSVKNAAQELQKDITLATNAKLPLQNDAANIKGSFISVGNTQIAQSAGISSDKMADESFRIVTKNGNLYILGPDTPDGGWTKNDGESNGTANGVYTFLENYLNVRWLMPGDIGRDVPIKSTFTVKDIDHTATPKFDFREMRYIWDYANPTQYKSVQNWMEHQRLGGATRISTTHNMLKTINAGFGGKATYDVNAPSMKKAFDEHPEWFPMDKEGNRVYPKNKYAKIETTNQELVKWFAEQAIKSMKANERPSSFSLSPSDGSTTWSRSPESVALYDADEDSKYPIVSSLVAKWYHDVAQIVAKEYPQGRLGGFIYSTYVYPPTKVSAKLPKNFTPMIAPSKSYGYGLYQKDTQKYFHKVMDEWAKIVDGNWYYYDLPILFFRNGANYVGSKAADFPGSTGVIMPSAPEIANIIFPQLLKSHINGAYLYGGASWSNAALTNYMLAKMEWDPTLNAEDVQREWLQRAYGAKAGEVMQQFYNTLNARFKIYAQGSQDERFVNLGPDVLQEFFGKNYADLEKLFLQAKAQPMTDIQKARLQLIEDNLVVLQWRLRNIYALPTDFTSPLQRNDAQVSDLIARGDQRSDFVEFPGVTNSRQRDNRRGADPLPWKVLLSQEELPAKSTFKGLDDNQFLFYAVKDGDIRINTTMVTQGAYFAAYEITNQRGEYVASGIFNTEKPIIIAAKAGESYVMTIPLRKPSTFQLQVSGAAIAKGDLTEKAKQKTLALYAKNSAPVYVVHQPDKNPIGLFEDEAGAVIRYPYSGQAARDYAEKWFDKIDVLNVFDNGWRIAADPQNELEKRGVLQADFDDSKWIPISPLNWWQMQGISELSDYRGTAWYRIKFNAPPLDGRTARFYFGGVDGNAEVYLNGKKAGQHLLTAPNFEGWDKHFRVNISPSVIKPGENILVVKVTGKDKTGASGIFKGVALIIGTPK